LFVSAADSLSLPVARKTGRYYRPELDVLRFVAFLLVFFHHVLRDPSIVYAAPSDHAADIGPSIANAFGFGLCVFYFLSAYLIATLLLIELNETQSISVWEFYLRRVLRIWPLYALGLAIGGAFALMRGVPEELEMFRYYTIFMGNWFFQDHDWNFNPMTPLWSISIEEQFYLILPLLVLALGMKRLIWGGVGIVMLSIAALYYQGERHLPVDTAIWTNTLSQAIFFGAGIVAAVITYRRLPKFNMQTRTVAAAAAFIFMFLAAFMLGAKAIDYASSGWTIACGYILVAAACALLLVSVLNADIAFPAPIVYLGKISFGLYVYHLVAMRMSEQLFSLGSSGNFSRPVADLCALPLVVLYAALSYRYVERPFLRLRAKFTYVASRPD
jgi:peptidoglycan/LPS O-acetylase OafA/YrhL